MSERSRLKETIKVLEKDGCEISRTGKGHFKIKTPDGRLFTASSTPSCPHAHRQLLRDIRRYK